MKKYTNDHRSVEKDEVVSKIIPPVVTPCSLISPQAQLGASTCMSPQTVEKISVLLGIDQAEEDTVGGGNDVHAVEKAKEILGCGTEVCVLRRLEGKLGRSLVEREIRANLKVEGPTGTGLLTNVNIDAVMSQWALKYRTFFAYNFNMRNYKQYSFRNGEVLNAPDTLATVDWSDLIAGSPAWETGACVANTDVYQNMGKHWIALFVDLRGKDHASVEFFNSSGNSPQPEYLDWLIKTKLQVESTGRNAKIIKCCSIRHQHSMTECGVYSLFYIYARLNGVPAEYFMERPVPDQLMFEFRQHLFTDGNEGSNSTYVFSWDSFAKKVPVKWERLSS